MRVGFGIREAYVCGQMGGGGRFSALLRKELMKRHHEVTFGLKEPFDILYDVANSTSIRRFKRIQRKVPVLYRMDGLGGIVEHRPKYIEKCARADCVVFQSRFSQKCVECFTKVKRSIVIHNGVELQKNVSVEPRERTKILVYLRPQNTWGRRLGGQEWLEVLEQCQAEFDYELVRIDKVFSLDRRELFELMKECDVFIHTAYYEACSNALLEAMSCGCAVLSTDDSGNAEIIGENGCLVKTRPAARNVDYDQFTHKDCDFLPIIEMDRNSAREQLKRCLENLRYFKQYSLDRVVEHFNIEKKAQEYLNEMRSLVMDQSGYRESQAKRFFGSDVTIVQGRLKKAYRFFKPLVKPNEPLLDVGTRDGWLLEYLKRKKFSNVLGIELTEDAVKHARSQGRNVIWGDAHDLSAFGNEEFGTVLMIHSLEHCYNPKLVADNVYRVLKPGGVWFIEVPLEAKANEKMAHFCNFMSVHDVVQTIDKSRFEPLKDMVYYPDPSKKSPRHLMCAFRRRP